MTSTFPAAISNEPPPLDASSEDEDSEEFRSHCLKLDVPSGEPTPVSTPFKRPQTKSPGKTKSFNHTESENISVDDCEEDVVLRVSPSSPKENHCRSENYSPNESDSFPVDVRDVDADCVNNVEDNNNTEEELSCTNVADTEVLTLEQSSEDLTEDPTVPTSASVQNAANFCNGNDDCDTSDNPGDTKIAGERIDVEAESTDLQFSSPSTNEVSEGSRFDSEEDQNAPCITTSDNFHKLCASSNSEETSVPCSEISTDQTSSKIEKQPETALLEAGIHYSDFSEAPATLKQSSEVEAVESCSNKDNVAVPLIDESTVVSEVTKAAENDFDDDEDDDDFGAFQSIPSSDPVPIQIQESSADIAPKTEEIPANEDEDDDFGDFAQVPAQQQTISKSVPIVSSQSSFDDSGDFADFRDCSFQSFDATSRSGGPSTSDLARISSKIDTVIKSLFVMDSTLPEDDKAEKLKSIDNEISIEKDKLWARVQDFEGSQGLMFKWLNCLTEKHLLRSLNIDNSNIMYHEKWGTIEVPKFAASLVQTPLQPQSFLNQKDPQMKLDAQHSLVNNNNNNVTDEGISCQDHDKPPSISVEAQEILRQLPELSYMRANTLVFPQSPPSGI